MRNWIATLIGLLMAGMYCAAQVPPESAIGHSNFSNFANTRPLQVGSVVPATCMIGQMFFNTAAPSGQNIYICPATNIWVAITSGGGGGSGTVSASGVGSALVISDSGSVNAYAGCPSPSVTLTDGMIVNLRPLNSNTGSSTFALCSGSALPIANANGTALAAGQILAASAANPSQAVLIYYATSGRYELSNQPYPILPAQSLTAKYMVPVTNGLGYTYMQAMTNPAAGRRSALVLADGAGDLVLGGPSSGLLLETTTSGGSTAAVAAAGSNSVMSQTTSGSSSGNNTAYFSEAGGNFSTAAIRLGRNVVFDFQGAIGAATSVRSWIGLQNCGSPITGADTLQAAGCAGFAFRFSTNASDSAWHCNMSNGSAADTIVNSLVTPDTNPHRFTIIDDDTGGTLHWYIDSVEVCTGFSVSNLATGNVGMWAGVTTLAAQNNSISFASLFIGSDK